MAKSPSQAVAKSKTIHNGYKGLCLVFVRTCYGIAAKYPSAASAWANAKKKHPTRSLAGVPIGAPVFFSTPATKYGHVALYLGGNQFRTNYSAKGTVVTATLGKGALAGMTMLGWTEDLNGVDLNLPTSSAAYSKATEDWQRSMNQVFPAYANFAVDGKYEDYSHQVTKEFQRRVGISQTGKLDATTKTYMRRYGVKI